MLKKNDYVEIINFPKGASYNNGIKTIHLLNGYGRIAKFENEIEGHMNIENNNQNELVLIQINEHHYVWIDIKYLKQTSKKIIKTYIQDLV
jgi:hypothetical protein